jgi:hypothetical protein
MNALAAKNFARISSPQGQGRGSSALMKSQARRE